MIHARIGKKIPPAFSLDVEFDAGACVTAIFGPAGSGKTLILEAIAGLILPESGRILRDDVLLFDAEAGVHVPPRRRGCVFVSQQDSLFPHLTFRQNLMFAAQALPRLERHRRVAEILDVFGLTSAASRRPAEVDGDQRLRAALARALISSPKLLLIDGIDVPEALFHQLRGEFAGPVLLATRDLDLCCALSDQMLVVDSGRILRRGAPREVMDQPESVTVARLVGFPNVFECTIAGLDPGRNRSRLESAEMALAGPYFPGHFRGDHVSIGIRPERVRVHAAGAAGIANAVTAQLLRASYRTQSVRLEFAGGIFADLSRDEYERQKDNRGWQVEFPSEALRLL